MLMKLTPNRPRPRKMLARPMALASHRNSTSGELASCLSEINKFINKVSKSMCRFKLKKYLKTALGTWTVRRIWYFDKSYQILGHI